MRKGRKWLPAVLSAAMVLQPLAGIGSITAMAADGIAIDDTTFSDTVFRKYVSQKFDADGNGYLSEDEISDVTEIDVSGCSPVVKNLNGIEYFTELTHLDFNHQGVRQLNIYDLTKLEYIDASSNMISDLTLPRRADNLLYLNVGGNYIRSLISLADYDALTVLNLSKTNLSSVDVSKMKNLKLLDVSGTTISTLNLDSNQKLKSLYCQGMTALSTLDVSGHTDLQTLMCNSNSTTVKGAITKLNVSGCAGLRVLNCSMNNLVDFIYTDTPSLSELDCSYTKIKSLDLSQNTELTSVDVSSDNLGRLDVSNNLKLQNLTAQNAGINTIDVSMLTGLQTLNLTRNNLVSINVSNCRQLENLLLSENNLESIDVSKNTNLSVLRLDNNRLVCIDVEACEKLLRGGSFSCEGNSRDIMLDSENYDFDLSDYSNDYGFYKGYTKKEIINPNAEGENDKYGRTDDTIGYAGVAIDEQTGIPEISGGEFDGYHLIAKPEAKEITYGYYVGLGWNKAEFKLNIQNPLTVVVWYTTENGEGKSESSKINLKVGDTTRLTAKTKDGVDHQNITWSSGNEKVAVIDEDTGELTCIASGTAQIFVNLNGRAIGYVNAECHDPVNKMSFVDGSKKGDDGSDIIYGDGSIINMEYGRYASNTYKYLNARFYNQGGQVEDEFAGYTCKVEDEEGNESNTVVTFNDNAISTCGAGTAYLHFTSKDNPETSIVIQVNVKQKVDSISLSKSELYMMENTTVQLKGVVNPATAENKKLIWSSSDKNILDVDDNGNVTALKVGEAYIYCAAAENPNNVSASCYVIVQPKVSGITFDKNELNLSLPYNTSGYITVTYDSEDKDVTYKPTWTSSNEKVVTVDEYGSVTAHNPGTAVVKCALSDTLYAECKVSVIQSVTDIKVTVDKDVINEGDELLAKATVLPSDATNGKLKWTSSDENVAVVDENGKITAKSKGYTYIKAEATDGSGISEGVSITVNRVAKNIKVDKTEMIVYMGIDGYINASIEPLDASDTELIWESSDNKVATVSYGTVSGVAPGNAIITCRTKDGTNLKKVISVTVKQQITEIKCGIEEKKLKTGEKFQIPYTVLPETVTDPSLKWTSSNKKVVTVDAKGVVKAVGPGYASITVEAADGQGATAYMSIQVVQPVTKIKLNKTSASMFIGKTLQLTGTALPQNSDNTMIAWSSSNKKIATVDEYGNVNAVAKGSVVITCKAADGYGAVAKCTIAVKQPVTSVKLSATKKTLIKGTRCTLKATVGPTSANDRAVLWSSTNTKVATVTSTGVVKAVGKGTATIICKAKDGSGRYAKCKITSIVRVSRVKLNKTSVAVKRGGRVALKATVAPTIANNRAVAWTSSNKSIATVAANGVVTGKKKGKAVITCKAKDGSGKYARCTVVVK